MIHLISPKKVGDRWMTSRNAGVIRNPLREEANVTSDDSSNQAKKNGYHRMTNQNLRDSQ